jgi:hypothetical protein
MDCLLQTSGLGSSDALLAPDVISGLGFDGVALTVSARRLVGDDAAWAALLQHVSALRSADLTVPMVSADVTASDAEDTLAVFDVCDEANVRVVRVGSWPYEFPGYRMQARHAAMQLEELQSLAESSHLRLVVPTVVPGSIQSSCAATSVWLQECNSRVIGLAVSVDLSAPENISPLDLEIVADDLALIEVSVRPGKPADRTACQRLADVLGAIDYNGPIALLPPEDAPIDDWSDAAQSSLALLKELLDLEADQEDDEDTSAEDPSDDAADEVSQTPDESTPVEPPVADQQTTSSGQSS